MSKTIIRTLVPLYLTLITGVPLLIIAMTLTLATTTGSRVVALLLAPPLFCLAYVLVAGSLSRLTLRAIVAGKYPRNIAHPVYGPRRLYALCWTAIYYNRPLYHAVLALPAFKHLTFRLFGYRGSTDFQAYPDTWLRDLPLLRVGQGAYLSNKATVSPNMCLQDGSILVLPVHIGERTMVGHLSMIAPGVVVGDDSELGVGLAVGVKVQIGSRTHIDHNVVLDHGATIGNGSVIGTRAYVGRKSVIGDNVRVPPGMVVPAKSVLRVQADVYALARQLAGAVPGRGSADMHTVLQSMTPAAV